MCLFVFCVCHSYLPLQNVVCDIKELTYYIVCVCVSVSLENVVCDVKECQRGMDLSWREYSMHGHNPLLKDFISKHETRLQKLQEDAHIAQARKHTFTHTHSYTHTLTNTHKYLRYIKVLYDRGDHGPS